MMAGWLPRLTMSRRLELGSQWLVFAGAWRLETVPVRRPGVFARRLDRERVAEVLRDAYTAGCLDSGELEQRSGKAYSARTLDDLRALLSDLPGWLLERPLVSQDRLVRSPRRVVPGLPWGFGFTLAGLCLIAVAVAWAPLAVVPLVIVWLLGWLLVMARADGWPPRSARHRSRPGR